MTARILRRWGALALVVAIGAGCAGGGAASGPVTTSADSGPPVMFVTLGSSETSGDSERREAHLHDPLRTEWSQRVYRSLPLRSVHVNVARRRSTVFDGLTAQLPEAEALQPTVATVWFGTSDAFAETPPARFQDDLEKVVRRLRAAGTRVILVMGPPPADGDVDTTPYTDRVAAVAERTGVEVVDLRKVDVEGEDAQATVADAITEALGPVR